MYIEVNIMWKEIPGYPNYEASPELYKEARMTKPELILYKVLENLINKYGEGNVPRETLDELWDSYPIHIWQGLKDKGILTKENDMCYLNVPRET